MGKTINLCAKIPEELHAQAREEQEELGVTLNEYVNHTFLRRLDFSLFFFGGMICISILKI